MARRVWLVAREEEGGRIFRSRGEGVECRGAGRARKTGGRGVCFGAERETRIARVVRPEGRPKQASRTGRRREASERWSRCRGEESRMGEAKQASASVKRGGGERIRERGQVFRCREKARVSVERDRKSVV